MCTTETTGWCCLHWERDGAVHVDMWERCISLHLLHSYPPSCTPPTPSSFLPITLPLLLPTHLPTILPLLLPLQATPLQEATSSPQHPDGGATGPQVGYAHSWQYFLLWSLCHSLYHATHAPTSTTHTTSLHLYLQALHGLHM